MVLLLTGIISSIGSQEFEHGTSGQQTVSYDMRRHGTLDADVRLGCRCAWGYPTNQRLPEFYGRKY